MGQLSGGTAVMDELFEEQELWRLARCCYRGLSRPGTAPFLPLLLGLLLPLSDFLRLGLRITPQRLIEGRIEMERFFALRHHFAIKSLYRSRLPSVATSIELTRPPSPDLPDNLSAMRSAIEAAVPHGRTDNGGPMDRGAWGDIPKGSAFSEVIGLGNDQSRLWFRLRSIYEKHPKLERASARAPHHLGTLGTGNHFIEICLDEEQRVWIMLHSGSRGIGNAIGTYFINRAKEDMRRWFVKLPDADLAYLPEGTEGFDEYIEAVAWAQDFAAENRRVMLDASGHFC